MKMIEDGMYYDNTSLYHEAYKRLRADYTPPVSIDMRLRLIPKKIIHNGPATVVIWGDGEKTVVKLMEGDTYDEYAAFTAALAKRIWGSTSRVKRALKDATVEQKEKDLHLLAIEESMLAREFDSMLADRILNNK